MTISPYRLQTAISQAQQLVAGLPDDDRLRLDTIEGETDVMEIIDALLAEAMAAGELAEIGKARVKRFAAREERLRGIVARILEALELPHLVRPFGTLSIAQGPASVVIQDQDAIPEEFWRMTVDKAAIGKALRGKREVPGAALSNAPPSLRITIGPRQPEQEDAA